MISKNCIKHINSLELKKFRTISGTFIAQGRKVVNELLRSRLKIKTVYALKSWIEKNSENFQNVEIQEVSPEEIKKLSDMQTPPEVLAEVFMKEVQVFELNAQKLYLCLDSVRDPGNFGTILRIANWFGINDIIASEDCVDLYNSKVIQAAMGSAFRINVFYTDLTQTLSKAAKEGIPVYGTFLDGKNIYQEKLSSNGIIVLGNEGHGILPETEKLITKRLFIPSGADKENAPESLNVSSAASVVCSEFFRRKF